MSGSLRFTRRERDIVRLIAGGRCDKEIATALGIAPRTVRTHLERFFVRNGVHTRTEAVTLWLRHSWKATPDSPGSQAASGRSTRREDDVRPFT
jgi:DNA-binding CsgD family transcriptional regulator